MSLKARLYLLIVCIAGLLITIYALGTINKNTILIVVLWTIIATPFEIKSIRISGDSHYTLSFAIHLSILIIYGQWVAIVVAACVTIITDLIEKRGLIKLLFNFSQFSIALFLAGTVFNLLKKSIGFFILPDDLFAFVCASALYVVANLVLVSIIVALSQNRSVYHVVKLDFKMVILYFTALVPMSMLAVLLYKEQPLAMVFIIPPLALAHNSFRNYASLKAETRKTLETLADFVDRRDHYTSEHSKRVAMYASAIAREMEIDDSDIDIIELAGRVHDLGKITISDSILLKSGPLTAEEKEVINSHPEVAYNILKSLNMYKTGSIMVREHHERYDGLGYPRRIKDKNIHLGSRIMAVADAYDAMTSDRPYRKAMTRGQAINELKTNSGTQFDPVVVEAFIKILEKGEEKKLEVS